jgi:hypothetical protein
MDVITLAAEELSAELLSAELLSAELLSAELLSAELLSAEYSVETRNTKLETAHRTVHSRFTVRGIVRTAFHACQSDKAPGIKGLGGRQRRRYIQEPRASRRLFRS